MKSNNVHRKQAKCWNIPGHAHFLTFSCYQRLPLLTNEVWRSWLGQEVRTACDDLLFALWAYVFMPEHVHLLVHPKQSVYSISDFRYRLKRPFAERVMEKLKEGGSPLLDRLRTVQGGRVRYRFWQAGGGHDLNLWTMSKIIAKAEYCHRNPIQRRLVKSSEQWRWSSFRWLEMGRREGEPLHLDDWDERTDVE